MHGIYEVQSDKVQKRENTCTIHTHNMDMRETEKRKKLRQYSTEREKKCDVCRAMEISENLLNEALYYFTPDSYS